MLGLKFPHAAPALAAARAPGARSGAGLGSGAGAGRAKGPHGPGAGPPRQVGGSGVPGSGAAGTLERAGGRGDSSDRSCPVPSERARPRSGFNGGPCSAPRGRRPQRTAPRIPTPTHLQAPRSLVWAGPIWGVCPFPYVLGEMRSSGSSEDSGQTAYESGQGLQGPFGSVLTFLGKALDQAILSHGVPNSREAKRLSFHRRGSLSTAPGALPQDLGNNVHLCGWLCGGWGRKLGGRGFRRQEAMGEEPWRGGPGEERCLSTGPIPSLGLAGMDQLTFPEVQRQPLSAPTVIQDGKGPALGCGWDAL